MAESPEPPPGSPAEPEIIAGRTIAGRVLAAAERVRILRKQIEEARARHRSVDVAFATIERDSEIGGSLLAGALAYRLFVFLLPFAVFVVVGLGLYAGATDQSTAEVAGEIGMTRIIATHVSSAASDSARWWVLVVSVPVLAYAIGQLYRSIAIVHALAYHGSGRAVKLLPRSIGLFGLAVIGQAAAVNVATALSRGSILAVLLGIAVGVVSVSALWLGVTELFPHATASLTERIPGAVLYGVGTLALYLFNAVVIGWLIEEREDSYGALGAAAALLFSLYLTGRLIVASAALNAVVLGRRTHASS